MTTAQTWIEAAYNPSSALRDDASAFTPALLAAAELPAAVLREVRVIRRKRVPTQAVRLATVLVAGATLHARVAYVVAPRSEEEVLHVDAQSVITPVKHAEVVGDGTVHQLPRYPVRQGHPVPDADRAVSGVRSAAGEYETASRAQASLRSQALWEWGTGVHARETIPRYARIQATGRAV